MTAKREDWKSLPLPALRSSISLDREYTEEEQTRIKAGMVPAEMEDKWFVFYEDPWLFVHRSWTGFCIYQVRFEQSGNLFKIAAHLEQQSAKSNVSSNECL